MSGSLPPKPCARVCVDRWSHLDTDVSAPSLDRKRLRVPRRSAAYFADWEGHVTASSSVFETLTCTHTRTSREAGEARDEGEARFQQDDLMFNPVPVLPNVTLTGTKPADVLKIDRIQACANCGPGGRM